MAGLSISNALLGSTGLSPGGGLSRGSGLSFGGFNISPVYTANFLLGALPTGVTVSSPSLGGLITDATGKLTYKPNNLLTYSNTFSDASWTKNSGTVSSSSVVAPDGNLAWNFVPNAGTGAAVFKFYNVAGTYMATVYVKDNGLGSVAVSCGNSTIGYLINFNLTNGTFISGRSYGGGTLVGYSITSKGGGFYQISVTVTESTSGVYIATADGTTGNGTNGVYIASATLSAVTYETSPRPNDQVITTSSAYYGPAFDYSATSVGTPLGLRIWEQRQNICLQSSAFSSPWTTYNASISSVSQTAPDGSANSIKLVSSTPSSPHTMYQQINKSASSVTYTYSVYAKSAGYSWITLDLADFGGANGSYCNFDITNGITGASGNFGSGWTFVSSLITPAGNGWYRCVITATSSTATNVTPDIISRPTNATGSFGADGVSGAYIWGAQVEAGAFAGPYIPTGSAAVTAAADVVTQTSLPWYNTSQGTWVASFDSATSTFAALVDPNISFAPGFYLNDATFGLGVRSSLRGLVYTSPASGLPYNLNVINKYAYAYQASNYGNAVNGTAVATNTTSNSPGNATAFQYGGRSSTFFINGHFQSISYYSQRLPNATLQTLTA